MTSFPVTVVIASRNRGASLERTLDALAELPERPPVLLVDNASEDRSVPLARQRAGVEVVALEDNHGAAARNLGVQRARTPYVAFCDDDSWWAPGALSRVAELFDSHPRLGLVAARVLVEPEQRLDPVCEEMARSPLPRRPDLPGPAVLGFVACGAAVRRDAFLAAGGFHPRCGVGGEEGLLALDLAAAGWGVAYVDDVVAFHHPAPTGRDAGDRRRNEVRNALWLAWLRRPMSSAARRTAQALWAVRADPAGRRGFAEALAGVPWVARERSVVPADLERGLRAVDQEPAPG